MTSTRTDPPVLTAAAMREFRGLRGDAIGALLARFREEYPSDFERIDAGGRELLEAYLGSAIEFLAPVLEFGLLSPLVEYLRWSESVLLSRRLPTAHLARSLDWIAEYFATRLERDDAAVVAGALQRTKVAFSAAQHAAYAAALASDGDETGVGQAPVDSGAPLPAPALHAVAAWPECGEFMLELLDGDRVDALALLERRLAHHHTLLEAELHLIQPALYEIGRRWQADLVTVAQEHLATSIAQSIMAEGLARTERRAPNGRTVLLACVAGNHHSVGLQMVADAFTVAGWNVQFLGADVPTDALLAQIDRVRPDLVGLSATFAHQLHVVKEIMSRLIEAYGVDRPTVLVGGQATNHYEELLARLGADRWSADADAAILAAEPA